MDLAPRHPRAPWGLGWTAMSLRGPAVANARSAKNVGRTLQSDPRDSRSNSVRRSRGRTLARASKRRSPRLLARSMCQSRWSYVTMRVTVAYGSFAIVVVDVPIHPHEGGWEIQARSP